MTSAPGPAKRSCSSPWPSRPSSARARRNKTFGFGSWRWAPDQLESGSARCHLAEDRDYEEDAARDGEGDDQKDGQDDPPASVPLAVAIRVDAIGPRHAEERLPLAHRFRRLLGPLDEPLGSLLPVLVAESLVQGHTLCADHLESSQPGFRCLIRLLIEVELVPHDFLSPFAF